MFHVIKRTFAILKQSLMEAGGHCQGFDIHHYVDTCASVNFENTQWTLEADPELPTFQNEESKV